VIALRTAQDYLKSAHARRIRLSPIEEEMQPTDTSPSPERRTLVTEMQEILAAVLQEINEDQRTVYLLHVKDELTIPEIAAALDVSENTVRSRLARANEAIAAAVARLRTVEEKRQSAVASMLLPAALADAARKALDVDPAVEDLVWSRLVRLLGIGIVGMLAPLSGAAVVAGAVLLVAAGGAGGVLLRGAVEKHAPAETIARVDTEVRTESTALVGASATASATATSEATAAAAPSASVSAGEVDAGAPDRAALLRAENAILTKARDAMGGGKYDVALRELNRHERLYPHGMLADARKAMKQVVMAQLEARDGGGP
jgi:hypothetical protein